MNVFAIVTPISRRVEDVRTLLLDFNRIPEWNPVVTTPSAEA
jgi:hypothetical protein